MRTWVSGRYVVVAPAALCVALTGAMLFASAGVGAQARVGASVSEAVTVPANDESSGGALSADGRFVVFSSSASNLVPRDTNGKEDDFVRDRLRGTTERVSVSSDGAQGDANSGGGAISANGRFVVFCSSASNLVPRDTNGKEDDFVRDRLRGTTERVSVSSGGAQGDALSGGGAISADGQFVAFTSSSSNLVPGDTNSCGFSPPSNCSDVFVRDRVAGTTERVSVSGDGAQGNGDSFDGVLSADGRFVAFTSLASNLVPGDTTGGTFVHDRLLGTTERVAEGATVDAISADGRFVAFSSGSVFVRDRFLGTTELVGRGGEFALGVALSADGRFVAFSSWDSNLVAGDTNDLDDAFVRDRLLGTTERVSVTNDGTQALGRQAIGSGASVSGISADGRYVTFTSDAANLVTADATGHRAREVFVRDRSARTTTLVSVGHSFIPHAGRLLLHPWPARAGKRLNSTMLVAADDRPVTTARLACAATLAGRKLAPSVRSYHAGSARCEWKIPKTARREQLKGSLTVTTLDGTTSRRFAGTVR